MILHSLDVDTAEFEQRTGWSIKPEGACKGEMCVPLAARAGEASLDATRPPAREASLDARMLSERLAMPLVADDAQGMWALGPESGGRALTTALAPDLELPTRTGEPFALRSLRGQKIFLLAWASW